MLYIYIYYCCDYLVAIGAYFDPWLQNVGCYSKSVSGITCQAMRKLPFNAMLRPVEARVSTPPNVPD